MIQLLYHNFALSLTVVSYEVPLTAFFHQPLNFHIIMQEAQNQRMLNGEKCFGRLFL